MSEGGEGFSARALRQVALRSGAWGASLLLLAASPMTRSTRLALACLGLALWVSLLSLGERLSRLFGHSPARAALTLGLFSAGASLGLWLNGFYLHALWTGGSGAEALLEAARGPGALRVAGLIAGLGGVVGAWLGHLSSPETESNSCGVFLAHFLVLALALQPRSSAELLALPLLWAASGALIVVLLFSFSLCDGVEASLFPRAAADDEAAA